MNFLFRLIDGSVAALQASSLEEAINKMSQIFGQGTFEPING